MQDSYVKAFVCDCECGWTIDQLEPDRCWGCGSMGPHTIMTTSRLTPKYLRLISDYSEQFLFSEINNDRN